MPKMPKNAKKVVFLRGCFFDDFLDGQKFEKWRHASHRVISSPGPGLHWGTIGGTINQQPINSLSNTPMGQRPGEFFNPQRANLFHTVNGGSTARRIARPSAINVGDQRSPMMHAAMHALCTRRCTRPHPEDNACPERAPPAPCGRRSRARPHR